MKKSLLIIIAFVLFNPIVFSQSGKLNRANKHFEKGNYEKAFKLYQKAFEKEKDKDKARNYDSKINGIHAAIKVEDYIQAEYWLGYVLYAEGTPSEYWLYYAACLVSDSKCDLGLEAFNKYKMKNPNDQRIPYFEEVLKSCNVKTPTVFDWNEIIIE